MAHELAEYEVVQFEKGDFQDNFGNYWCTMVLRGISEPVRIVVKDPMEYSEGMKLYGKITDEKSKAGKSYQRFRREKREEGQQSMPVKSDKPSPEYWDEKNSQIKAQWAIGQSLSKFPEGVYEATDENRITMLANIEDFAKELFAMVDRVSGKQDQTEDKDEPPRTDEDFARSMADSLDDGIPIEENPFND